MNNFFKLLKLSKLNKPVQKATPKFEEYLNTLPKVYLIGYWAQYGIREYPFEKCVPDKNTQTFRPLVWYHEDGNGTCDEYHLIDIEYTTTGQVLDWTFNKEFAEEIVKKFNNIMENKV